MPQVNALITAVPNSTRFGGKNRNVGSDFFLPDLPPWGSWEFAGVWSIAFKWLYSEKKSKKNRQSRHANRILKFFLLLFLTSPSVPSVSSPRPPEFFSLRKGRYCYSAAAARPTKNSGIRLVCVCVCSPKLLISHSSAQWVFSSSWWRLTAAAIGSWVSGYEIQPFETGVSLQKTPNEPSPKCICYFYCNVVLNYF